jgi:hypothetical protein
MVNESIAHVFVWVRSGRNRFSRVLIVAEVKEERETDSRIIGSMRVSPLIGTRRSCTKIPRVYVSGLQHDVLFRDERVEGGNIVGWKRSRKVQAADYEGLGGLR